MKPFELFKAGKHTASGGTTLSFTAEDLQAAVAAYDPALHEAPIVVGHPRDNAPAYGWIKSLRFSDGSITAEPAQVDEAFAEMVKSGRFKKRSASFYMPDAPNNPKPGSLYLRHVGFLGAQPPAVKGLKEVAFSDSEEGVVEFGDASRWAWSSMAAIARNFREWVIGEKGVEAADKVVPNYLISDLDSAAKAESTETQPAASPAFSEGHTTMPTPQEMQATIDRLTAENATLKANQKPVDFAERESSLAAREAKVAEALAKAARVDVEARVDAAVKGGRLLPAQRKHAVEFAMALSDDDAVIEFGEGDKAKKVSQREAYLLDIESRGKVVEFDELSRDTGAADGGLQSLQAAQKAVADQVFNAGKAAA
jgi:hypothetical protein